VIVDEVVFVFTNARVGESKKGMLEFRNLNLIPLPKVTAPVPPGAVHAAMASQVQLLEAHLLPASAAMQNVVPKTEIPVLPLPVNRPVSSSTALQSVAPKTVIPIYKLPVKQPLPSSLAPQAPASTTDISYSVSQKDSPE
jgi:hypothetical protein